MSGAVLTLSPRSWAHVALALAHHSLALEDKGQTMPRDLALLLDAAVELAKSSPRTDRDRHALDSGPMISDSLLMDGTRLIGVRQVARWAGMSERTVQRRLASGELPSVKNGRRRLVRVRDLRPWVDAQKER